MAEESVLVAGQMPVVTMELAELTLVAAELPLDLVQLWVWAEPREV